MICHIFIFFETKVLWIFFFLLSNKLAFKNRFILVNRLILTFYFLRFLS